MCGESILTKCDIRYDTRIAVYADDVRTEADLTGGAG